MSFEEEAGEEKKQKEGSGHAVTRSSA
jgi:hypothetical protein